MRGVGGAKLELVQGTGPSTKIPPAINPDQENSQPIAKAGQIQGQGGLGGGRSTG